MANEQVYENLLQELRRGVIVLAVLGQLQEEQYGYSILKQLAEKGLEIDQGTLYPLLHRLEADGLLKSTAEVVDGKTRKYYTATQKGRKALQTLHPKLAELTGETLQEFRNDEPRTPRARPKRQP